MALTLSINENECTFEAHEDGRRVAAVSWHAAKEGGAVFDARLVVARGRLYRDSNEKLYGEVLRTVVHGNSAGADEAWVDGKLHETGTWVNCEVPRDQLKQVGGEDEWVSEWWDFLAWSPLSAERDQNEIVFRRVDGWEVARVAAPLSSAVPGGPPPLNALLVKPP